MAFSAIQILVFHLWIYLFNGNPIERFIKETAYLGVDIFFFVSGYSLAKYKIDNYFKFLVLRFKSVYLKFIFFAAIMALLLNGNLFRFLRVVSGIELIKKGGGAFLWFLPAIMLFYIVFPIFQRIDLRNRSFGVLITLLLWVVVAITISRLTSYTAMFIYWNRIPVFLLGYYSFFLQNYIDQNDFGIFKRFRESITLRIVIGSLLSIAGFVIIFFGAYKNKLQWPICDGFYLLVIPASLGLILLIDLVPATSIIKLIGDSTLEIYALQMIFGYNIANALLKATGNRLITNIVTILVVIILGIAVQLLWKLCFNRKSLYKDKN